MKFAELTMFPKSINTSNITKYASGYDMLQSNKWKHSTNEFHLARTVKKKSESVLVHCKAAFPDMNCNIQVTYDFYQLL